MYIFPASIFTISIFQKFIFPHFQKIHIKNKSKGKEKNNILEHTKSRFSKRIVKHIVRISVFGFHLNVESLFLGFLSMRFTLISRANFRVLELIYVINTFKYHVFAPMGRFQLELIYLYFSPSSHQIYVCFCPVGLSLL